MKTNLLDIIPILPSQNIDRDTSWYETYAGFKTIFKNNMYAILRRDTIDIHLQWHADSNDDPLLGGSVVRILVNDIQSIFQEFLERKTVTPEKLKLKTAWSTNEFGFYDLNKNAVFVVERLYLNHKKTSTLQ